MKLHDSRQLGPLVFRDPLLLCSALYFLLYFDASGFLRLGLCAAFLHEWGHILGYWARFRTFPTIEVTLAGFCMRTRGRSMTPQQTFWLAAAGPGPFTGAALLAGCCRPGGQFHAGRHLGTAAGTGTDHPRQCLLGGKSADRGIQSAARSTAGWGAAGVLPVRNAACRQKV